MPVMCLRTTAAHCARLYLTKDGPAPDAPPQKHVERSRRGRMPRARHLVQDALLLLVGFIIVFLRATPYLQGWLNELELERDALAVDAATLFLGLALFLNDTNATDAKSDWIAIMVSLTVVAINVWFVMRVTYSLRSHSAYGAGARRCCRKAARRAYFAARRTSARIRRRLSRDAATDAADAATVDGPNPMNKDILGFQSVRFSTAP